MIQFLAQNWQYVVVAAICITFLKGVALWRSANKSHKGWFMALLILNTIGILEMIYIAFVGKRQ